jgi:hypothetical protein
MQESDLEWGQTPWDTMSKDELLRCVQKMYSSVVSLHSALKIISHGETSGYWGESGTGGCAIEKGRQVLEPLWNKFGNENIYRAFFRYADDLLFDCSSGYDIGFKWAMCPVCGTCIGEGPNGVSSIGKVCGDILQNKCTRIMRALEWSDLKPQAGA